MIELKADTSAAGARLKTAARAARMRAGEVVAKNGAKLLELARANLTAGPLRDSLRLDVQITDVGAQARVASDLSYARLVEYGGRIAIPEIAPRAAKALAFPYEGKLVFAAHTRAHTAQIPARPYLAPALAEIAPAFEADLDAALP